jgi:hypothetical protein
VVEDGMMSDYRVTINGVEWEYAPRDKGDPLPWTAPTRCRCQIPQHCERLTSTDLRAIADVMDRWAQDHQPQRRRVAAGMLVTRAHSFTRYWARHTTLPGFVSGYAEDTVRGGAVSQVFVEISDADLDTLLSLRKQPNEEVPSDE